MISSFVSSFKIVMPTSPVTTKKSIKTLVGLSSSEEKSIK